MTPAKPVSIRLTDEERTLLESRATAKDQPLSVYIREAALASHGPAAVREPSYLAGREAFLTERIEQLTAAGFHPLRIQDLAEAEWESIERDG